MKTSHSSCLVLRFIRITIVSPCKHCKLFTVTSIFLWDFPAILYNVYKEAIKSNTVKFSSVAQSCPTFCDPMDCSTPGFPVHHQLLELTQTHVHHVGDAIQPSHPLSPPSPPAFNHSQMSQFFASGGQSIEASASALPMNIQD